MWISSSTSVKSLDRSRLSEEATFHFKTEKAFEYKLIVEAADFINNSCPRANALKLDLSGTMSTNGMRPLSTSDYYMASYLVRAVKTMELEVTLDTSASPEEASVFLNSAAPFLTSLKVGPRNSDSYPQVATAIGMLPKLRKLELGSESLCTPMSSEFLLATMVECTHNNEMRLEELRIKAPGLHGIGIGMFLLSGAASGLNNLDIETASFHRLDAIELTVGLAQSTAISQLTLQLHGSKEEDFTGIPVLCAYMKKESSIQTLSLGDWGEGNTGIYTLFYKPLLQALHSKTTLKALCLDGFSWDQGSEALKELLSSNPALESLDLKMYGTYHLDQEWFPNLAEGVRQNQSLRSFKLEVNHAGDEEPDVFLDLSSIFQAMSERQTAEQVMNLDIHLAGNPITETSWESLNHLLEQPQSQLESLALTILSGKQDMVSAFVQSMKDCESLKRGHLVFYGTQDVDTAQKYADPFVNALGQASSGPTTISVDHRDFLHEEIEEDEWEEMKRNLLECMEANTHLESVSLEPFTEDADFHSRIKFFCTRNKVTNAAASLEDGTLNPLELPGVLSSIEADCEELGESPGLHFVNIWFSLIRSRPLEAANYSP